MPDGASVDGERTQEPSPQERSADHTTRRALGTKAFWYMSFGQAAAVAIVSAVIVHFVLFLTSDLGYSIRAAASVFAFMTIMSFGSQLLGGVLGDAIDKRILVSIAMCGHAVAMLLLALFVAPAVVAAAAALHGLSWGLRGPSMGAMRVDYFGRTSFATIMGFSSVIIMVGSVSGPLVTAAIADATGSYVPAFMLLAAVAVLGMVFFSMLPNTPQIITTPSSAPAAAAHPRP